MYYASSKIKVDSVTFIPSKKIIKLPKYIYTHIMLFHSIKQHAISVNQLLPILFPNATAST